MGLDKLADIRLQ